MPSRTLQFGYAAMLAAVWLMHGPGPAAQTSSPPANSDQAAARPSNEYPLGPDSLPHADVPHGQTFEFRMQNSKTFPNTSRTITVYVPAQYRDHEPACVYVGLDGLGMNAPVVFDNLIARHAIPIMIGVGISPGTVAAEIPAGSPRYDRSFEFDSRTDRLATLVLDVIFPAVEQRQTTDGRRIQLSTSPDCRMVGGSSTGAIAAFNVAWQRPQSFHRVFSSIGTFVGMRGGESFYIEVRKSEPRPIRVFLQDGAFDQWPGGPEMGDWWMSNQTMERALSFAGYDVRHVWGNGTHNGAQAAAVFPEAMEWLWRDYPSPVLAAESSNPALKAILDPGQTWHVASDHCSASYLASAPDGRIFVPSSDGKPLELNGAAQCANAPTPLAFGADGTAYSGSGLIRRWSRNQAVTVTDKLGPVQNLIASPDGDLYAIGTVNHEGILWLVHANGQVQQLAHSLQQPSGLALSPDKAWLFVTQQDSRYGYSFRVRVDGTVDSPVPFFDFFVPAETTGSQAHAVSMDKDGRAYVATAAGVQVFDHNGRVIAILTLPSQRPAIGLCFGGKDFRTLYVADGEHVYSRVLNVTAAASWMTATPVPNWGPG